MTVDAPKATVVRVLESLNGVDLAALEAHPGLRAAAALLRRHGAALPEGRATIATLLAEGEWVAARLLGRGIGSGRDPAPVEVLALVRVVGDRIVTAHIQGRTLAPADSLEMEDERDATLATDDTDVHGQPAR